MFIELISNPFLLSIYALLFGSFLSVCIYRIPYGRPKGLESLEMEDEEIEKSLESTTERINIFFPKRSFCPHCKEQLLWRHNVPVFSWLIQRGKCAFCKGGIPFRYPLVEILSVVFAMLCYFSFSGITAFIIYLFCCSLIVISFIDIDYYIIPDVISYPGMILGIVFAGVNHFYHVFEAPMAEDLWQSFYGLLAGGGFLFVVSELYFRVRKIVGLGFGDVKLMAMAGLFFGPMITIQAIFLGSMAGSLIGLAQIIFAKKDMQQPLPFGPYLAIGIVLALFSGSLWIDIFLLR